MKNPQHQTESARHWAQMFLLGLFAVTAVAFQNCGQGSAFELSETLSFKNGQGYGGVLPPDLLAPGTGTGGNNQSPMGLSYFSAEICGDGSAQTEIRVLGSTVELHRRNCQDLSPALVLPLSELLYSAMSREVVAYQGRLLRVNGWQDVVGFCRGGVLMSETEARRVDILVRGSGSARTVDVREGVTVSGVLEGASVYTATIAADANLVGLGLPAGENFRLKEPLSAPQLQYQLTLSPRESGPSRALRSQSLTELSCVFE